MNRTVENTMVNILSPTWTRKNAVLFITFNGDSNSISISGQSSIQPNLTEKNKYKRTLLYSETASGIIANPKVLFVENYSSIKNRIIINEDILSNMNKLSEISKLQSNWNGNGALPFSKALIDKVRSILLTLPIQPEVFPTADNSIQLEYDGKNKSYLEFQIYEDADTEIFCVDQLGREKDWTIANNSSLNEVILQFYE